MKADISIVLPVCNVDAYLNTCLDSITAQEFQNWEAILVDDGSIDFSEIICDSYSRKDSRFRVIHQENKGVSAARNAGIDAATAPLLAFIDPDDFISINYFSRLVGDLSSNGAEMTISNSYYVQENGSEGIYKAINHIETNERRRFPDYMGTNKDVLDALCKNFFHCGSWGKVFTRELWGDTRFPVYVDLGEDVQTIPPVIVRAKSVVYSPEAVYFYRQRKQSLVHGTVTRERTIKEFRASGLMADRLTDYCPERRRDFERLEFQHDITCFMAFIDSGGVTQRKQSRLLQLQEFKRLAKAAKNG